MNIQVRNLNKAFGSKTVLKDINLDIKKGEILALLGPNGAGKSTLIKILTGSLKADQGEIWIDGQKYSQTPFQIRPKFGVMPQEIIVWQDLNILENLQYTASIYKLPKDLAQIRIQKLINDLKLSPELKTLARDLSGGYQRRLNLAISILHNPSLIFLDEPTPGIDAQSRILLTEYITKLVKEENCSLVLTDHYLEEAQKLADYVIIIDNGEIVTEGSVPDLQTKYKQKSLEEIFLLLTGKSVRE